MPWRGSCKSEVLGCSDGGVSVFYCMAAIKTSRIAAINIMDADINNSWFYV